MKYFFIWVLICLSSVSAQELTQETHKAVAQVVLSDSVWHSFEELSFSSGTGFFVDQQTLVTNYHVISSLLQVASDSSRFEDLLDSSYIEHEGQRYSISGIRNVSAKDDLAILQVEGYKGPILELAEEEGEQGSSVIVQGFTSVDQNSEYLQIRFHEITGNILAQNFTSFCSEDSLPLMFNFFGNLKGMSGSPILNKEKDVTGILYLYDKIGGTACGTGLQTLKRLLETPPFQSEDIYSAIRTQIAADLNQAIKGDRHAQYVMGGLLLEDTIPGGLYLSEDYVLEVENMEALAISFFTSLAERGNPAAQRNLGNTLYRVFVRENSQHFVEHQEWALDDPDLQKGLKWIEKAAYYGDILAQFEMISISQKEEDRLTYLKLAAYQNYIPAQYALNREMAERSFLEVENEYRSQGVATDDFVTLQELMDIECALIKGLKEIADRGFPSAQFDLAQYVIRLARTKRSDYIYSAIEWYEKAAHQGHGMAQLILGQLFYYGYQNVFEPDEEKASYWLLRARQNGFFIPFNDDLELLTTLRLQPEDSLTERVLKLAGRMKIYFSQMFEDEESDVEASDTLSGMDVKNQGNNSEFHQKIKTKVEEMATDYFDQCLSDLNVY